MNDTLHLTATCTTCEESFELRVLARRRDGRCPGCGVELAEGWTTFLVEESEALQTLFDALARGVARFESIPSGLTLDRLPLLDDLRPASA